MKPNANWKHWERGWGWSLELYPGLKISVSKGMARDSGFKYKGLERSSKKEYIDETECKLAAEAMAKRVLTSALQTLAE